MENILIVGYGEIGRSIDRLYDGNYKVGIRDKKEMVSIPSVDVMHICIPYNKNFIKNVVKYIDQYKPRLTIINSSVPIGTTRKIHQITNYETSHSPIIGKHPELTKSLKTFTKIVGGCTQIATEASLHHFGSLGLNVTAFKSPEESELAKLLSTTYYGMCISFMQQVHDLCKEKGLKFDNVYKVFNEIYNQGYKELGYDIYNRPVLKYMGKGIGGHCVYENAKILNNEKILVDITKKILSLGKAENAV